MSEKFCLDSLLHELVMLRRAKLEATTVELRSDQTSLAKLAPAMLSRKTTQLRQFHPLCFIERTKRDVQSFD
jgi:U3 small nucleolar RNA-associated protein 14